MKNAFLIIFILFGSVAYAQDNKDQNKIHYISGFGYVIDIYDHSKKMLSFMKNNKLQGGGPTWMALVTAALELESPGTLKLINFDDEADTVRISSKRKNSLEKINHLVSKLKSNEKYMLKCISKAKVGGYLE